MEHNSIINTLEESIQDEIDQIPVFHNATPPHNIFSCTKFPCNETIKRLLSFVLNIISFCFIEYKNLLRFVALSRINLIYRT